MNRRQFSQIGTVLVLCLAVSVASGGFVVAAMSPPGDAGETPPSPAANVQSTTTATAFEVAIDCSRMQVTTGAPPDRQYWVELAVVNVTPTTSSTLRTTSAPFTGNATVNVTGTGAVFAFVMTESERSRPVARAFAYCGERDEPEASIQTREPSTARIPSIRINCTTEDVRFLAPAHTRYVATVAVVDVSPTRSSATRLSRTFTGNATLSVETRSSVIVVFASRETVGDESTVSAIRNCGPPSRNKTVMTPVEPSDSSDASVGGLRVFVRDL